MWCVAGGVHPAVVRGVRASYLVGRRAGRAAGAGRRAAAPVLPRAAARAQARRPVAPHSLMHKERGGGYAIQCWKFQTFTYDVLCSCVDHTFMMCVTSYYDPKLHVQEFRMSSSTCAN